MECTICNRQYVGKYQTPFNIRLNNHKKDAKDSNAILADKQFQKMVKRFNEHATFTIIGTLTNTNLDKEILILFRMGGGGAGQKGPPYQFFPCNFYKGRN